MRYIHSFVQNLSKKSSIDFFKYFLHIIVKFDIYNDCKIFSPSFLTGYRLLLLAWKKNPQISSDFNFNSFEFCRAKKKSHLTIMNILFLSYPGATPCCAWTKGDRNMSINNSGVSRHHVLFLIFAGMSLMFHH